jgi:hypothetical protein
MPTSYYSAFEVKIDNDDGTTDPCPLQLVKCYDVTHTLALADLMTDANGLIEAGSLAVDPATLIRFSFSRVDGICGYTEIFTVAAPVAMAARVDSVVQPSATIVDQTRGSGV